MYFTVYITVLINLYSINNSDNVDKYTKASRQFIHTITFCTALLFVKHVNLLNKT